MSFGERLRRGGREGARDGGITAGFILIVVPLVGVIFQGESPWVMVLVTPFGVALLLWLRPGRPRRGHVAWVARVEPDPADVADGRSFEPFYVPECGCGWEEFATDDADEARREAEKHAERVEPGWRRTHEPVEEQPSASST
jgi:hypothetical protein